MIIIELDPVAFAVGPLAVRWYGIIVALATALAVIWAWRASKGTEISQEAVYTVILCAIPLAVIISRLVHVIDKLDYYLRHPGGIVGFEGLSVYGAILGASLALWLVSRFKAFSFGRLADLIAPGAILAQALGRVGCIINGCCYGKTTSVPWAFVYTHPNSYAPKGVPVHPTHLYELIWDLIVFGILWLLRRRLRPEGSLFLVYLAAYSAGKFVISFFREGTVIWGMLYQSQIIAIVVLAIVVPLLAYRARWMKTETSVVEQSDEPQASESE